MGIKQHSKVVREDLYSKRSILIAHLLKNSYYKKNCNLKTIFNHFEITLCMITANVNDDDPIFLKMQVNFGILLITIRWIFWAAQL